jgi:L-ribulose-5-phosphate 3-epimerase
MNMGFRFLFLCCCFAAFTAAAEVLYENDFQSVDVGQEPDGFLVLDGDFVVKEENGNRFLELPGAPLENFGALFGSRTKAGSRISVTVKSQANRRLAPSFGVGVNGLGGFRLMMSGNKRKLELLQGDEVLTSVDFRWQSKAATRVVLEALPESESSWRVRGKVWSETEKEPVGWHIEIENQPAPPRGKASIWGYPFSGHAIRYDDLLIESTEVSSSYDLGLQTWTVRNMSFEQMVGFASKHQFKWLALSRTHMDPRAAAEETMRKKAALDRHGLVPYTFGVARTSLDHEDNRKLFEFAKVMGIRLIVVEPDDFAVFESLERLVREYDIKVAIHNHGIRSLYGNPLVVRNVIKHLDPRIGVCLDTGWVTAAGFDPSQVYRDYGGRVFDIHLKDKRTEKTQGDDVHFDTHIGQGKGKLASFLRVLREEGFEGVLALETDSREFAREPEEFVTKAVEFFETQTLE